MIDLNKEAEAIVNQYQSFKDDTGVVCVLRFSAISAVKDAFKQSEPKWISVNERLPEIGGQYYLVYNETKGVFRSFYNKGFKCFETIILTKNEWHSEEIAVTHWMPLPEKPIK